MLRVLRERSPERCDGVLGPVEFGQCESEVVVELRLLRPQRRRPLEQRQRVGGASALIQDDAQIVKRERMLGGLTECRAIVALGVVQRAAAMRRKRALHEGVG